SGDDVVRVGWVYRKREVLLRREGACHGRIDLNIRPPLRFGGWPRWDEGDRRTGKNRRKRAWLAQHQPGLNNARNGKQSGGNKTLDHAGDGMDDGRWTMDNR